MPRYVVVSLLPVISEIVGCIWRKPVLTYASIVYTAGFGEFGEYCSIGLNRLMCNSNINIFYR